MSKFEQEPLRLTFAAPAQTKPLNLNVDTGSSMAEAFVVDGNYKVVARGTGIFRAELQPGKYQLRVRVGNKTEEQWVDLTENKTINIRPDEVLPNSAAPIDQAKWPESLLESIQAFAQGMSLVVVVRDDDYKIPESVRISVFDLQGRRKRTKKQTLKDGHILAIGLSGLKPGSYRLHVGSRSNSPVEMCIWISAEFQTQVYFTRCPVRRITAVERAPHFGTAAITIVSHNLEIKELRKLWRQTEMARATLAGLRSVAPVQETMLAVDRKWECPMLGLLGAHQLYRLIRTGVDFESVGRSQDALMKLVIGNLGHLLPSCPDVLALRLAYGGETDLTFKAPPMLWESWNLIAPNATLKTIPRDSLASQIGLALTNIRPWLVWKTDLLSVTPKEGEEQEPRNFVERRISQTKKTYRKIGALADQYSLPRSTIRHILKK
jgi:hypothetical protein